MHSATGPKNTERFTTANEICQLSTPFAFRDLGGFFFRASSWKLIFVSRCRVTGCKLVNNVWAHKGSWWSKSVTKNCQSLLCSQASNSEFLRCKLSSPLLHSQTCIQAHVEWPGLRQCRSDQTTKQKFVYGKDIYTVPESFFRCQFDFAQAFHGGFVSEFAFLILAIARMLPSCFLCGRSSCNAATRMLKMSARIAVSDSLRGLTKRAKF